MVGAVSAQAGSGPAGKPHPGRPRPRTARWSVDGLGFDARAASPVRSSGALTGWTVSSGSADGRAPTASHPAPSSGRRCAGARRRSSVRRAAATSGSRDARSHSSCSRERPGPWCRSGWCPRSPTRRPTGPASGRKRHLGEEHRHDRLLPGVEDGQQQALLAPEVGVDGARGATGGLGHRVDGDPVDALLGEEVGGGREQPPWSRPSAPPGSAPCSPRAAVLPALGPATSAGPSATTI